jgi:hypothetical protein
VAPPAWLDQYIKALNETREALNALLNATDIDKAEAALNRLMERLQNLPTPAKAAIAKQIERLREVIDQAKTAGPEARRQIIEDKKRQPGEGTPEGRGDERKTQQVTPFSYNYRFSKGVHHPLGAEPLHLRRLVRMRRRHLCLALSRRSRYCQLFRRTAAVHGLDQMPNARQETPGGKGINSGGVHNAKSNACSG